MIKRIIISGGSNSGKTTIIEKIKRLYEIQGIKVIVINDSIEELVNDNIDDIDYGYNKEEYTNLVIEKEIIKEKLLEKYLNIQKRDVLVIYNRGPKLNGIYNNNKNILNSNNYDLDCATLV